MNTHQNNNMLMAVLAYVGPLVIISYLLAKGDSFVKFHIKQGLILFVIEVAVWFFSMFMFIFFPVIFIINIAILVLVIIGIINAVQKKEKELPLVGSLAKNFTF